MARLYSVVVEKRFTMMVLANDEDHACKVAIKNADDESNNDFVPERKWTAFGPARMDKGNTVPREWKGAIPWSERDVNADELTVENLLGVEVK